VVNNSKYIVSTNRYGDAKSGATGKRTVTKHHAKEESSTYHNIMHGRIIVRRRQLPHYGTGSILVK
jgi:hypothetical protein